MKCKECGQNMQWRSTNQVTRLAKYKCPVCGNVQIGADDYVPLAPQESREPKYYSYQDGSYVVKKWVNNHNVYIGSFANEETAKMVVDKMIEYDWDKSMIPHVYEELGIHKVKRQWVCAV